MKETFISFMGGVGKEIGIRFARQVGRRDLLPAWFFRDTDYFDWSVLSPSLRPHESEFIKLEVGEDTIEGIQANPQAHAWCLGDLPVSPHELRPITNGAHARPWACFFAARVNAGELERKRRGVLTPLLAVGDVVSGGGLRRGPLRVFLVASLCGSDSGGVAEEAFRLRQELRNRGISIRILFITPTPFGEDCFDPESKKANAYAALKVLDRLKRGETLPGFSGSGDPAILTYLIGTDGERVNLPGLDGVEDLVATYLRVATLDEYTPLMHQADALRDNLAVDGHNQLLEPVSYHRLTMSLLEFPARQLTSACNHLLSAATVERFLGVEVDTPAVLSRLGLTKNHLLGQCGANAARSTIEAHMESLDRITERHGFKWSKLAQKVADLQERDLLPIMETFQRDGEKRLRQYLGQCEQKLRERVDLSLPQPGVTPTRMALEQTLTLLDTTYGTVEDLAGLPAREQLHQSLESAKERCRRAGWRRNERQVAWEQLMGALKRFYMTQVQHTALTHILQALQAVGAPLIAAVSSELAVVRGVEFKLQQAHQFLAEQGEQLKQVSASPCAVRLYHPSEFDQWYQRAFRPDDPVLKVRQGFSDMLSQDLRRLAHPHYTHDDVTAMMLRAAEGVNAFAYIDQETLWDRFTQRFVDATQRERILRDLYELGTSPLARVNGAYAGSEDAKGVEPQRLTLVGIPKDSPFKALVQQQLGVRSDKIVELPSAHALIFYTEDLRYPARAFEFLHDAYTAYQRSDKRHRHICRGHEQLPELFPIKVNRQQDLDREELLLAGLLHEVIHRNGDRWVFHNHRGMPIQLPAEVFTDQAAVDGHQEALTTALRLAEERFRDSPQTLAARARHLLTVLQPHWQIREDLGTLLDRLLVERYGLARG